MSCYFSACCIASCEPAQIHGSISKMKMEIQKKIWTSIRKKGVNCSFCAYMRINSMRGSRIFLSRGVQARWPENSIDNVFLLFLQERSNGFITEKTILFQGSRGRGSSFFPGRGGVQMLISIEPHITCDFPRGGGGGGVQTPIPSWIRT